MRTADHSRVRGQGSGDESCEFQGAEARQVLIHISEEKSVITEPQNTLFYLLFEFQNRLLLF